MRLLVVCDIGGEEYHAGDDAMFDAALQALRVRLDASVTLVGRDCSAAATRHQVMHATTVDFAPASGSAFDTERDASLAALLGLGGVTDFSHDAASLRRTVDNADAVLIAGGGNMSASWPHLFWQRIAITQLAHRRGLPVVLTGQTLGPRLTDSQQRHLADLLGFASFAGLRDAPSLALARAAAPAASTRLQLDDAALLPGQLVLATVPPEYVALVVHPFEGATTSSLPALVHLVHHLHATTSLPVIAFPNTGPIDGAGGDTGGSDVHLAALLARHVGDERVLQVAPLLPAAQFATAARGAAAMVTTRFHPAVFAVSGHVPVVALATDRYTGVKLTAALGYAGLEGWVLPVHSVAAGAAAVVFDECWSRRYELTEHLVHATSGWASQAQLHWDAVSHALTGGPLELPADLPAVASCPPHAPVAALLAAEATRQHLAAEEALVRFDRAEEYALSLKALVEVREAEVAAQQAHLDRSLLAAAEARAEHCRLADEVAHVEEALRVAARRGATASSAAEEAAAELARERDIAAATEKRLTDALADALAELAASRAELAAVHATRTMRWTYQLRRAYGRLRRLTRRG